MTCCKTKDASSKKQSSPGLDQGENKITAINLLTYNVLADPVFESSRIPALLKILEDSEADIIALQEVAPWFLEKLMAQDWVRQYHPTLFDGKLSAPGGQFILSRLPIEKSTHHLLPGKQQRTVVIARVPVNGKTIAVATTHMESYLEDGPIRAEQLDSIFSLVKDYAAAIVLGDFNFGDGEEPETGRLDDRYVDMWTALEPKDPGFTWNMEESDMALKGAFKNEKSRRLDRILVRMSGFKPKSIRIIGNNPVHPDAPHIFPSDHYGLSGVLKRIQ